jgi:20S proteasome alpha/beta subunit
MTNQEAAEELQRWLDDMPEDATEGQQALRLAVKALEREGEREQIERRDNRIVDLMVLRGKRTLTKQETRELEELLDA